MKQDSEKQPINKEAFKMLATEVGLNEAARRLGVPIPTAKSWARRYGWKLPKRRGGRPQRLLPTSSSSSLHPIADALDATHKDMEETTKTALMQTLTKAALQVAGKNALDINNPAQFQAICLAAARVFGWKGDSQVNVAVDARMVVVTEEHRKVLQAKLKAIQDAFDDEKHGHASSILPTPETQLQANVGARNDDCATLPDPQSNSHTQPRFLTTRYESKP